MLVLVSEDSQVSEKNAAVIRKLSGICRAAKAAGEILKTFLVPYSHGFILELITLAYVTFPGAYATSVNIHYAYVHACAYAYVAV